MGLVYIGDSKPEGRYGAMKYILIWVITATNGIAAGELTSGSAEFGSYEACLGQDIGRDSY